MVIGVFAPLSRLTLCALLARIGGFEEHERKYGSEAYFRKLKEQQETAL